MQSEVKIQIRLSFFHQFLLVLLFAGLLSIPFLDHDKYYFAWFAFVPLLFAIENASLKRTYFLGVLAGLVLFVLGTYWVYGYIITAKGLGVTHSLLLASAGWFYSAQVIALILLVYKYLSRATGLHEFILFPVTVAAGTAAFPMLFAIRLGESQVNFYYALQAIELFGVHGLDFVIALTNILIYQFLCNFSKSGFTKNMQEKISWFIAISVISVWFLYGVVSYHSWSKQIDNWDTIKVGLIQPNETPSLKGSIGYPEYSTSFPPEMEMTSRLAQNGAELIVWSEAQAKNYLNNSKVRQAYSSTLRKLNASLLFQDTRTDIQSASKQEFNMAVMLNAQGQEIGRYKKIKRIPIGEYIPFADRSEFVRSLAPSVIGDATKELEKGEEFQVFKHHSVNVIPLICYETTFPDFVASAVKNTIDQTDKNNGTIIVGMSNDGWFKSLQQSKLHIFASSLRAVENRLPLVHAVNNGPSIVVLPNGKRIFTSDYQQAGGYLVDVPYSADATSSFYSRYSNWFKYLLYVLIVLLVLYAYKKTDK